MNRTAIFLGTVTLVLLLSGSFHLDPVDPPEQLTADTVLDADRQDDACAQNQHTCEQDAQEAAKDPRVQATLQRLCATGQPWACTMTKPSKPAL